MIDLDTHLPAIQAGDTEAFAAWLAGAELPLRRSLRRFAFGVDTEAVTQETLLRIWQVAGRCRPDGRPNALLRLAIRIGRNLAIDELRKAGAQLPATGNPGTLEPPAPDPLPDPLLRRRILECLEKLPGQPHAAILSRLRSDGGVSDSTLAGQLHMRLNTFLQNIVRARKLLADCLRRAGIEVPV